MPNQAVVGLPPGAADIANSREFAGVYAPSPLDALDPDYLESRIAHFRGQLSEAVQPRLAGEAAGAFAWAIGETSLAYGPDADVARWREAGNLDESWAHRSALAAAAG